MNGNYERSNPRRSGGGNLEESPERGETGARHRRLWNPPNTQEMKERRPPSRALETIMSTFVELRRLYLYMLPPRANLLLF
ncbi:hypothetical protein ACHAWF_009635 [Thalassiosira exigua]